MVRIPVASQARTLSMASFCSPTAAQSSASKSVRNCADMMTSTDQQVFFLRGRCFCRSGVASVCPRALNKDGIRPSDPFVLHHCPLQHPVQTSDAMDHIDDKASMMPCQSPPRFP